MAQVHPDSFRALAYEVLNQLHGSAPIDDNSITIYQIENELRDQYGFLLEADDRKRLAMGQQPDLSRLQQFTIPLTDQGCAGCDEFKLVADVARFLDWNGTPFITQVNVCGGTKLTGTSYEWQLDSKARQTRMPAYAIQGSRLIVKLTADSAGIDSVLVTGIPVDPFYGMEQDDRRLIEVPWPVARSFKAQIKERAEMRFRGGSLTTRPFKDRVNNNAENPAQQQ